MWFGRWLESVFTEWFQRKSSLITTIGFVGVYMGLFGYCWSICSHICIYCVFFFRYLVHCLQSDLNNYMPAFLDDPEEQNPQRPKIGKQRSKGDIINITFHWLSDKNRVWTSFEMMYKLLLFHSVQLQYEPPCGEIEPQQHLMGVFCFFFNIL